MAVRPIVTWPDARLREPAREVTEITEEVRTLYRDLVDTMFAYGGVGIAAIQVGEPVQMFLVAFINPEIVWTGDERERADEGCLSFPGVYVPIERPYEARVRAMNIRGETFELGGEGLLARAFQHEHDHLTGRLLVDFVGPLKKQSIRRKLKRDSESAA